MTSTATVSGTVAAVNDAPVAANSNIIVAEESTGTNLGLSVPTDADNDSLTITVTGLPTLGAVTKADGSPINNSDELTAAELTGLVYNAPADYNGTDAVGTFTYSVNDGQAEANSVTTATVNVTVNPLNDATVVANDTASVDEDSSVIIDVLANDTDIDTGTAKSPVASVTQGSNGSVAINADGTLTYTPNADFNGNDSFTYTNAEGATATVNVTVNPINDAPTGTDGVISLDEDSSYSFSADDFGFSDADSGDSLLAVRIDNLPGAGSLQLNGTAVTAGHVIALADLNNLTFTPAHDASGDNYSALTFSVSDQTGQFAITPSTLTFDVTPVADAPIVTINVGAASMSTTTITSANAEASGQGFTVQAFNPDGTAGDISSNSSPIGFGVAGDASGDDNELGYSNGQSERLVVEFDAPVASATVSFAWLHTGERATYELFDSSGNLIGSNTLAGITDSIDPAITLTSSTGAAISRIEFSAPGAGDDYLINSIEFATSTNYPLTITATPTDIDYSESIASITVAVPAGATLSAGSANSDGTWALPLTSSGSYSVVVNSTTQAVSISGLSMTLPGNPVGSLSVTVTATAQDGADTESNAATITIGDATAPETGDVSVVANEDSGPIAIILNASDDASSIANFTITSLPANGTLIYNDQEVLIGQAIPAIGNQASLSFTPNTDWNGSTDFQYLSSDVAGNVDQTPATVSILINPINDAPVNQLPAGYTTNEDTVLKLSGLSVSDVDVTSGLISVTLAVASGTLSAATASGVSVTGSGTDSIVLSGTLAEINAYLAEPATQPNYLPVADASGSVTLTMTSNDGGNTGTGGVLIDIDTTTITINSVADAVPSSDVSVRIGAPTVNTIDVSASSGGLDGQSSYTFPSGITLSTGNTATPFSWTNGSYLGVTSKNGDSEIEGSDTVTMTFPSGMQYMKLQLKNTANDTILIRSSLEVGDLTSGSGTISGTITSTVGAVSDAALRVNLVLEVLNGSTTTIVPVTGVVTDGNWTASYSGVTGTITKATVVSIIDGDLFSNGGTDFITFAINTDMTSLSIAQDPSNTFSGGNDKNDGFQIAYVDVNASQTDLTSYSYAVDVAATIQDTVGTPESFTSLTLSDLPEGSAISVVVNGSYKEINAVNGVYDLSAYTSLLSTATTDSGTDKIYLVTSSPLPSGFAPTLTLEVSDGDSSTAKTIIGGSNGSIFTGGAGNDYISGGAGSDSLNGGAGNDILIGGEGDDIIFGGSGADTFVWQAGHSGNDVIKDFNAAEGDVIDLSDLLSNVDADDLSNYLRVDSDSSSLLISTSGLLNEGGNADITIKLENAGGFALSASDTINTLIAGGDLKVSHD
ncbi:Poly(beta-D-mannuronate) C5 epimerase 4 [compost metagenome]